MLSNVLETIGNVVKRVFGTRNERLLKAMLPIVEEINRLESSIRKLSDADLQKKTDEFRNRLADGETLDDLLPEAFAVVREASRRVIRTPDPDQPRMMRHFDVQLIGGIVLHQGKIAEMATGEGKTLVATLAAYLNALPGKGVHIVTVNDYLARRDRDWMGPVYEFLGLTAGVIQSDQPPAEKQAAYACDITYGTDHEFGFDYLRDNMRLSREEQVQRGLHYAIVDEVDSVLIDEARTPLIISGPAEESTERYYIADRVARKLRKDVDFEIKEKEQTVHLTEDGIERAESLLGVGSIYSGKNIDWPHLLEQALRAHHLFKRDVDYMVKDGEVIIVDEFTGRLMHGRRWSDGLHQAVEAKEHLTIKEENQTLATITYQNLFRLYDKLAGMTGTAVTEAVEFEKIYNLDVVVIPTNRPLKRISHPDLVYRTEKEKFDAVEEEIVKIHEQGRPILVGTVSIEKSEKLSERLKRRGIKHEVLNAKHHEREAHIIAKAGQRGNVTIATNMAGRGTDIVLGEGVAELGGLHVIGTERHEARRIDNQLRGRAGRQGDPGSSRFYVSLEDDLMRIFAGDFVRSILQRVMYEEGMALEHPMITRAIEKAQRRVEQHNFEIRKNLLEFDEVMNEQRKIIYEQRQKVLEGQGVRELIMEMVEDQIAEAVDLHLDPKASKDEWDYAGLAEWAREKFGIDIPTSDVEGKSPEEIETYLLEKAREAYELREQEISPEEMRRVERFLLLQTIDAKWKDHLYAMDHLRSGIGLRGYAQVDPKIEYKREGYELFDSMLESIKDQVTSLLFHIRVAEDDMAGMRNVWQGARAGRADESYASFSTGSDEMAEAAGRKTSKPKTIVAGPKIGRNDPCPCGSGKKYKKCCGRKAVKASA